jgi:hypothetical protein
MNIRNSIGFGITFLLVIVVCISFIVSSVTNFDSGTKKYFNNDSIVLENELSDILNKQMDCDNIIDGIISNIKKYDMNDPLILKNPYKINPLSALIFFYTEDELEVDVYINDGYMSTVKASKEHIIPIYGLENNRDNIVRLDFENGTTRTFAIKTELYNDYTEEYDLKNSMDGSQFTFLVGDRNNVESKLRGFDPKGNLTFYFDLDYITGALLHTNSVYVGYNSKYTKNNDIPELKIELDYLGKIISISTDTSDLITKSNVNLANIDYIAINHNVYQDNIENYKVTPVVDNNPTTETGVTSVDELALMLENSSEFNLPYVLSINGRYLTYDFKGNQDVMLLLINQKGNVYTYNVDDTRIIKLPDNGEYSVYAKVANKYYTLNTILSK